MMKAKKLFSVALAIALVFTASFMVFHVFATSHSAYKNAVNEDVTVRAMGSVQANAYSGNDYFSSGFATLRVDPLLTGVTGDFELYLEMHTYSDGNEELYYFVPKTRVSITSENRHINFEQIVPNGIHFEYDQHIDKLRGVYKVRDLQTGEEFIVPDIVLYLE